MVLLVYVDDIIITGPSSQAIDSLKTFLHSQFKLENLRCLKHFLGIEFARSKAGTVISQKLQLLEDAGYLDCKPVNTLMDSKACLSLHEGDLLPDASHYRRLIGS